MEYCYFFRKAFTRYDFTGDCLQTRVELCARTSDRERSTRAGEACMRRKRKPGPVLGLVSVLMFNVALDQDPKVNSCVLLWCH